MGLDFIGSEAHWSYSGFHHFRIRLAAEIHIDLDSMVGFGGRRQWRSVKDPIAPLLRHSDCDGSMTPSAMAKVAPRLLELVADWPEDDYDRHEAEALAADMARLAEEKKRLIFC